MGSGAECHRAGKSDRREISMNRLLFWSFSGISIQLKEIWNNISLVLYTSGSPQSSKLQKTIKYLHSQDISIFYHNK